MTVMTIETLLQNYTKFDIPEIRKINTLSLADGICYQIDNIENMSGSNTSRLHLCFLLC